MEKYIVTIIGLFMGVYLFGQVKIDGEIRPRSEFRQGYQKPVSTESTPAFFISQRSRLNLNYGSEQYDAYLSLQDVRVWGEEKFNTYNPSMALHQAWIKYKFCNSLSVKAGRQAIDFDDKRILSSANWSQTSKKHDAVLLNYQREGLNVDFVGAFNQSSEKLSGTDYSDGQGSYKYLGTLWVTQKLKRFDITAYALFDSYEPVTDTLYSKLTYGAITKFKQKDLQLIARFYGQTGKNTSAQKVESWLLNAEGQYKFGKIKVTLGAEILSGNDLQNSDGTARTFEMPYGAKHGFNGTMDYFKKSSDTKNCGLTDCYLKWSLQIDPSSSLNADYHWFSTTTLYMAGGEEFKKYLASELDLTYKRNVAKTVNLECGYSVLKGSSTLQALKGGNASKLNHWAYLMLTFKPVFL